MKKQYLFSIALVCSAFLLQAQYWNPLKSSKVQPTIEEIYIVNAEEASYYSLDFKSITKELENAPLRELRLDGKNKRIQLPLSDGSIQEFEVVEAPVMQSGLQSRYPHIRTYKGYAVDNPRVNVRLGINKTGFHAAIHSPGKIEYIDPQGNDIYVAYDVNSAEYNLDPTIPFCGVSHHDHETAHDNIIHTRSVTNETVPMHEYRVAIACTGEFGSWKGTAEKTLADIVTGVNRMNQIYENELSMRIILVNDNDKLFHFDKDTDPYNNTAKGSAMISVNTAVINSIIGSDAYDIGHVYSRSCDVGGIAALSSMCTTIKGNGCTCHYRSDIDYMAASVTSHEMGHQMSAQHTFNNCLGDGNETLSNGFEPGSGSTIMSYGGLCGSNNVVQQGDDYYHSASLRQIYGHLRNGGIADACATKVPTENVAPVIELDYKNNFYIPTQTYFYLTGSASDANNDKLTYTWEQMNEGPLTPLGQSVNGSPNFRCYPPTEKPYRYFLRPKYIMANIGHKTELLPKEEKNMKFNFVVRDNNPNGGIAVWEEMKFWAIPSTDGERFSITNFSSSEILALGEETEITWNVAHTAGDKINCKHFDLYAYNGDANNFHFDNFFLIRKNIPNTGSFKFRAPNYVGSGTKFILKASNNIFFDTNSGLITIEEPRTPTLSIDLNNDLTVSCIPTSSEITIKTYGYGGISGNADIRVVNELPEGVTYTLDQSSVEVGKSVVLKIETAQNTATQNFDVEIEALVDGVDTVRTIYPIQVINSNFSDIAFVEPAVNSSGVAINSAYSWTPSVNAQSYNLTVATSPSFDEGSIVLQEEGLSETTYSSSTLLDKNTVYYWKVAGINQCGKDTNPQIGAFATEALSCTTIAASELPATISSGGRPQVDVPIVMANSGKVADVNVKKLKIEHANNKEMTISLLNPAGDAVILVDRKCNQRNVNCSFDDSSPIPVKCPLNNGKVYQPTGKLSTFNDKESKGNWTLRVKDHAPGNGGRIQEVQLEICANSTLNAPVLVNNQVLNVKPNHSEAIQTWSLLTEDNDNTGSEIVYTIVSTPSLGTLSIGDLTYKVGDSFTQQDISNQYIVYNAGATQGDDSFLFTVNDGSGGLVGITKFAINIDESHTSSTKESGLSGISVYPNPTNELFYINHTDKNNLKTIELYDVLGNKKMNIALDANSVNVKHLAPGIYYVVFGNGTQKLAKRISIF